MGTSSSPRRQRRVCRRWLSRGGAANQSVPCFFQAPSSLSVSQCAPLKAAHVPSGLVAAARGHATSHFCSFVFVCRDPASKAPAGKTCSSRDQDGTRCECHLGPMLARSPPETEWAPIMPQGARLLVSVPQRWLSRAPRLAPP